MKKLCNSPPYTASLSQHRRCSATAPPGGWGTTFGTLSSMKAERTGGPRSSADLTHTARLSGSPGMQWSGKARGEWEVITRRQHLQVHMWGQAEVQSKLAPSSSQSLGQTRTLSCVLPALRMHHTRQGAGTLELFVWMISSPVMLTASIAPYKQRLVCAVLCLRCMSLNVDLLDSSCDCPTTTQVPLIEACTPALLFSGLETYHNGKVWPLSGASL